jgi:hypothetical protein
MMRHACAAILALVTLSSCADEIPDRVNLRPEAEEVFIAADPPSSDGFKMVGQVRGQAEARDLDTATEAAKNALRNSAANLGASLVTIDVNVGEPVLLYGKTKVTLVGRAYKSVD